MRFSTPLFFTRLSARQSPRLRALLLAVFAWVMAPILAPTLALAQTAPAAASVSGEPM